MGPNHILELCWASLTVILSVILVFLLKKFGEVRTDNIGPELNLLTYGFLLDTIIKAIRKGDYWPQFPIEMQDYKDLLLIFIVMTNTVLMAINFKLANKAQSTYNFTDFRRLRFLTFFLGIASLLIFLVLRVFLD